MGIKIKTQLIVLLSFIVVFTGVFYVARTIFLREYLELEQKFFLLNVGRLESLLEEYAIYLQGITVDYAYWDDSYEFINNPTQEFIESSLGDNAFVSNRFSYLLYQDLEGDVVYEKYFDIISETVQTTPASLKNEVTRITPEETVTGYVVVDNKTYLISKSKVRDSSGESDPNGYLSFVQLVDKYVIDRIESTVKYPVVILNEFVPPKSFETLSTEDSVFVVLTDNEHKKAVLPMPQLLASQSPYIVLSYPREIYQQGNETIQAFGYALLAIFAIMNLPGFLTLEYIVIRPITRLGESVSKITASKTMTIRLPVDGPNEIKRLAHQINLLLDQISILKKEDESNEAELTYNLKQLETKNSELTQTKQAILNVLDDAKALEIDLRTERDRAQAILSSMGEALVVLDRSLRVVVINPTAEKLLGVTAKDILGVSWREVVSVYVGGEIVQEIQGSFAKSAKSHKTVVTRIEDNHYYKTKSGKFFPVVSVTTPIEGLGAVKVFKDATEEIHKRETIERLVKERTSELVKAKDEISKGWIVQQREKAKLTASINAMDMGYIMTDEKLNVTLTNKAVSQLLGDPTKKEWTKEELKDAFGDQLDIVKLLTNAMVNKSELGVSEVAVKDLFLRLFINPISMSVENNDTIGVVMLMEDITQAKQLEASKDEFFAVASHELRTPLTTIRGNASLIKDHYASTLADPIINEMIQDIYDSSVRLIGLVNEYLGVSRLEQGRLSFSLAKTAVKKSIEEAVNEVTVQAEEKKLTLKIDDIENDLSVNADQSKLKEVLINLLGNAIKYTDKGTVTIGATRINDTVEFYVTDSGIGISPQKVPLLFKKFQQAGEKVLTRDTKRSTGLGLYISKKLVEGMAGSMYLKSTEYGRGSTFAFSLPIVI
jgi:PAS domain S-box-containing protein